jgi:hypothetical protein
MTEPLTHAGLAAELVTKGCLPMIDGKPRSPTPVRGVLLTQQQRGELGLLDPMRLSLEGETILYPVGADGVFIDLGRDNFTIWFNDASQARDALHVFELALKKAYPQTRYVEESPHPDRPGTMVRFYILDLQPTIQASVEVAFPIPDSGTDQFVVRVRGLMKPN